MITSMTFFFNVVHFLLKLHFLATKKFSKNYI
jgi:hypothetical protein